jgi:molybdate transport system regulatory protein
VGVGKVELLEAIAATGSLVRGARRMHMSYRRAWLLLHDLNTSFDQPVADASVGGRGGGGVTLTAFGVELVAGYRRLEAGIQSLAEDYVGKFTEHLKPGSTHGSAKVASIKRKTSARAKRASRRRDAVL